MTTINQAASDYFEFQDTKDITDKDSYINFSVENFIAFQKPLIDGNLEEEFPKWLEGFGENLDQMLAELYPEGKIRKTEYNANEETFDNCLNEILSAMDEDGMYGSHKDAEKFSDKITKEFTLIKPSVIIRRPDFYKPLITEIKAKVGAASA